MFRPLSICVRVCALAALGVAVSCSSAEQVSVTGRVLDENGAAVSVANVLFRTALSRETKPAAVATGPSGAFALRLPEPGPYLVSVSRQGFFALENRPVEISEGASLQLVLNHATELFETIEVHSDSSSVDLDQNDNRKVLSNMEILNLPYIGRDLGSALKLMPGVLQDSLGGFHLSGGGVNEVLYTLDGFNITDPLTHKLSVRMNIESVRAMQYSTGRYSPEYGKGSAGVVAIESQMGTDRLRYTATNFVPGIDTTAGPHIGTWSPRIGLSGPIRKGRAWFSESADAEYSQLVVEDVKDHNRTPSLRLDNMLRTQVNVTPTSLLFMSVLVNGLSAPGSGLSALDPYSATVNRRSRTWFFSFKHEKYLARGARLEWGYSENRTFARQIPQGPDYYRITPYGRGGNFFIDSTDRARRGQFLLNYSPSMLRLAGRHQLRAGVDLDRLNFDRSIRRTGYEQYGLDGRIINRITFGGPGVFSRPDFEASSYIADSWRIRTDLTIDAGIRQDWDELVRKVAFSPRLAASWAPFGSREMKLSGGFAITRDGVSLEEFSRPLDQYSLTTDFEPDGSAKGPASKTLFSIPNRDLKMPRYENWSAGFERRFPRNVGLMTTFLRKRGANGLTYLIAPPPYAPGVMAVFELQNFRRDVFDSAELVMRQSFGRQFGWMASYTRSRALSNSVISLSVDEPLWVANNLGRMPWDAPNRFLGWGYFPTPWRDWAVAATVDGRSGYPFTIQTDRGVTVGEVNSHRFPFYFTLDFHLERRFKLGRYRVALRGGFNNITNHKNPTVVNQVIGSPEYLSYYGSHGRHVVFRLRWLGNVEP